MREALIESACAAFAADGYAGASLKQIAAGASATTGAVYHHFPRGKEGLLEAVVGRVLSEMCTASDDVVGGGGARLAARLEGGLAVLATPRGRLVLSTGPQVLGEDWQPRWEAAWAEILDVDLAALAAVGGLRTAPESARMVIRGAIREAVSLGSAARSAVIGDLIRLLTR